MVMQCSNLRAQLCEVLLFLLHAEAVSICSLQDRQSVQLLASSDLRAPAAAMHGHLEAGAGAQWQDGHSRQLLAQCVRAAAAAAAADSQWAHPGRQPLH